MILVGDVGATKTLLEVGTLREGRWRPAFGRRYGAVDHPSFDSLLQAFFHEWVAQRRAGEEITRACFGVAGPMFDNRVQMTNLAWVVDGSAICAGFGIPHVRVVNDFAAAASGIEMLHDADLVALQPGEPIAAAPRVVIGAGTGLGVAYLIWAGGGYQVIAGEAGHAGFAPSTLEQFELWRDLYSRHGRVAVERVVSGPGLVRIHEFIERCEGRPAAPADELRVSVTPAAITHAALQSGDPLCVRALDMFVSCYGAVAGDHALAVMARGGVYVAGGIAPKILPRLLEGGFLAVFNARGAHSDAVRKIPVSVVTNERLGLLGAALITARR
ncbi:MAG: glucokinase [Betaproteobacteria bacterium]|nr:glucokinase [Betaproteobacteria bacterium]